MTEQESLYEKDICVWAERTAELLRSHQWELLDLENLIEEVEDLSKRERDKLLSCLQVLIMHLLKWKYQPELRCSSWEISISSQRSDIQAQVQDTPSLKQFLVSDEWVEKIYLRARKKAINETQLPSSVFPYVMLFDMQQILNEHFWP